MAVFGVPCDSMSANWQTSIDESKLKDLLAAKTEELVMDAAAVSVLASN